LHRSTEQASAGIDLVDPELGDVLLEQAVVRDLLGLVAMGTDQDGWA
jgi:hypothetical protein